jgi:hypothetical protein
MAALTEELWVDNGFKPDLSGYVDRDQRFRFFDAWKINPVGAPVATVKDRNTRAALWHGRRTNQHGELPVIIAELDKKRSEFKIENATLFLGIGRISVVTTNDEVQVPQLDDLANAAEYLCVPAEVNPGSIPVLNFVVDALTWLIPSTPPEE